MQNATKFYIPGNVKTLNLRIANSYISEIIFEEGLTVLNVSTYSNIPNTSGMFFPAAMIEKDIILPESLNEFNGVISGSGEYGPPFSNKLIFKGKTIEQVKQMAYYPFGIDESQIEVL
jgi:hypothetical protein